MTNINDKAIQGRVDQFLTKVVDRMFYLRWRWDDECKYEDFADYIKEARKEVNNAGDGFEFVEWSRDGHLEVAVEKLFVHFMFLESGQVLKCITALDASDEQWKKIHSDMLVELYKNKGTHEDDDDDDEQDPIEPTWDAVSRYDGG